MKRNLFVKNLLISILCMSYLLSTVPVFAQNSFGQAIGKRKNNSSFTTKKDVTSFSSEELGDIDERENISKRSVTQNENSIVVQTQVYYNVHVLGEVGAPGVYRIFPSERISDAVARAGSETQNGSKRFVQLRRGGENKLLDLMDYRLNGNLEQNPYLMDNDVVLLPIKNGEVRIEGPVNRPGVYEMLKPVTLMRLVTMAGNFASGHSTLESIRVVRYDDQEKKEIIELASDKDSLNKFFVQKGDVVIIPHILIAKNKFDYDLKRIPGDNIFYPTIDDNIYVIGNVSQPGPYSFIPQYNVRQYINMAGPYKNSKEKRVKIINRDGKIKFANGKESINPGDTIIVPEKVVTWSKFLTYFSSLSSVALTSFVFWDRFGN